MLTRRDWIALTGAAGVGYLAESDRERRIARLVREYEAQGDHRTATAVDNASGAWLAAQVRDAGGAPDRETFTIDRVEPVDVRVTTRGRTIKGVPLFDGGFTGAAGVRGRLGPIESGAELGLTSAAPNTASIGALLDIRRRAAQRAIVVVTRGQRPGLCPSNAEDFLRPFGPPVVQVSSEDAPFLEGEPADATVVAYVKRAPATAVNVTATIRGSDAALPPIVVMTPRSGWWTCASERGGGIACWLEIIRALASDRPKRTVHFVASSGHEIGYRGIEVFIEHRPDVVRRSAAWLHIGANVGAATDSGNTLQASDDAIDRLMTDGMSAAGLRVDRRNPRANVPGGEAGVVHRGGGRYVSIIGRNALFHNPADRGPGAVDPLAVSKYADAFAAVARTI
jgi:hypothetical protein